MVVFAHGSGSGCHSPRNRLVAHVLNHRRLATVLVDLLTPADDAPVLEVNRTARAQLGGPSALQVIPGAGHLFEEPGALDRVAALAAGWFRRHLSQDPPARPHRMADRPAEPNPAAIAGPMTRTTSGCLVA